MSHNTGRQSLEDSTRTPRSYSTGTTTSQRKQKTNSLKLDSSPITFFSEVAQVASNSWAQLWKLNASNTTGTEKDKLKRRSTSFQSDAPAPEKNSIRLSKEEWTEPPKSEFTEHKFKLHHFNQPVFCNWCSGFIWGLSKQGHLCHVCKYAVHKRCLYNLPRGMPCAIATSKELEEQSSLFKRLTLMYDKNSIERLVILQDVIPYLLANGTKEEGIFRISAPVEEVKSLKRKFDRGKSVDLSKIRNIHTISGALKLYFREMESPIFTYELYDTFLCIAGMESDNDKKVCAIEALKALPPANLAVLKSLLNLLREVSKHSELNKMTISNISTVFGPTLLRSKQYTTPDLKAFDDASKSNYAVQFLIERYQDLFIDNAVPKGNIPKEFVRKLTIAHIKLASSFVNEQEKLLKEGNASHTSPDAHSVKLEEPPSPVANDKPSKHGKKVLTRTVGHKNIFEDAPPLDNLRNFNELIGKINKMEGSERKQAYTDLKVYLWNKFKELEVDIDSKDEPTFNLSNLNLATPSSSACIQSYEDYMDIQKISETQPLTQFQ